MSLYTDTGAPQTIVLPASGSTTPAIIQKFEDAIVIKASVDCTVTFVSKYTSAHVERTEAELEAAAVALFADITDPISYITIDSDIWLPLTNIPNDHYVALRSTGAAGTFVMMRQDPRYPAVPTGESEISADLSTLVTLTTSIESYVSGINTNIDTNLDSIVQYTVTEFADTTNITSGTHYYPSSGGLSMDGYKDLSLCFVLSGGLTMTVEATSDDAGSPDWLDITKAGYALSLNSTGNANFVDTSDILDFDNLNSSLVRVKIVATDATNGIQIHARQKAQ